MVVDIVLPLSQQAFYIIGCMRTEMRRIASGCKIVSQRCGGAVLYGLQASATARSGVALIAMTSTSVLPSATPACICTRVWHLWTTRCRKRSALHSAVCSTKRCRLHMRIHGKLAKALTYAYTLKQNTLQYVRIL